MPRTLTIPCDRSAFGPTSQLCRHRNAHLTPRNLSNPEPRNSDEIYALSVFGDGPAFVSAAQLAAREAAGMPGGERADDLVRGRGGKGAPPGGGWQRYQRCDVHTRCARMRNPSPSRRGATPTHDETNEQNATRTRPHPTRQVHVIFGMSKDFCASGLRLGCLHSRNASLNSALVNLAYFTLPSSPTQVAGLWFYAPSELYFLCSYLSG